MTIPANTRQQAQDLLDFIDAGGLSRRSFLTRSAAFGAAAVVGTSVLSGKASAQEPKKGGILNRLVADTFGAR